MAANHENLVTAVDRLELALAANGPTAPLDEALAELEEAVRQHAATLADAEGRPVDVDRPLLPSPGVARRTAELRQELAGFLEEVKALRAKTRGLAPPGTSSDPKTLAGALPVAPEMGATADFGVFCSRARELIHKLQHFEEEEADLILKSVNTDIGAGD